MDFINAGLCYDGMDSANFTPQMIRTPAEMNALSVQEFCRILGGVYEHSPWIAAAAAGLRPFQTLALLKSAMKEIVRTAPEAARMDLIRAHPDLAGKLARLGQLTTESTQEQAAAGMDAMSPEELRIMTSANAAYRQKFGFPFIICARRHTRESILAAIADRLHNDGPTECAAALEEIHHIAQLRIDDLICPES